ncbi:MAG: hypothetical protein M3410_10610 [Acidobacteriota bacterium]|nr:hypothetical protein [Acidobacteriota bacterium]
MPLAFFLAQAGHYWRIDELGHMLWMCNIGNLVLAIGLFLNNALLIRVAVIWMFPGLVVWLVYVALSWGIFLSSTLAHVGGLIVGIFAIRRVGMDRLGWGYALGWYLLMQFLSRVVTPANLNVNAAHHVDPGWQQTFSIYWKFWLVLTLTTAIVLWIIGTVLHRIWPARRTAESVFRVTGNSNAA